MNLYIHRYEDALFHTEEAWINLFQFLDIDAKKDLPNFNNMIKKSEEGRKPIHLYIGKSADSVCPNLGKEMYNRQKECINKMGYGFIDNEWILLERIGNSTFKVID